MTDTRSALDLLQDLLALFNSHGTLLEQKLISARVLTKYSPTLMDIRQHLCQGFAARLMKFVDFIEEPQTDMHGEPITKHTAHLYVIDAAGYQQLVEILTQVCQLRGEGKGGYH